MNQKFNFLANSPKEVEQYFEDKEVASEIFEDPSVAIALEEEMKSLKADRESLRNSIFKMTNEEMSHMPVNLRRVVEDAKA